MSQAHWENVYERKRTDEVSWFRPHLDRSLELIARAPAGTQASVIDVGGGASTLVDDLLARGHRELTVVDLSERALAHARARVGAAGAQVKWLAGDITRLELPAQAYDVWHDRAVFHFLTGEAERTAYVAAVRRSVKPGGLVIVATFGPEGPLKCSGLDVRRYSADALHAEFGPQFARVDELVELHRTPSGNTQQFVYCLCRVD
jgi:ubiquinone/menaquinone biosynthesis C-methylase UbiE